ncbi:hypothetical protein E1B25_20335 [Antarcticimicrobium sediminis]|uniref:NusG-like N-terminal domain-containing protein n=2 Tax=Antarcticimicrobium sediminis TaxID=2546227 RepID=A0A4R5EIE6_9RHOB|nr:hypothetical protein E1B25_20335 [Antarcticimicrobium sediminis]
MMGTIIAQDMQWFAVRVKRKQAGGIRKVTVGGKFEAYRDRAGRIRKRRVDGTGDRVFLPEHILRRAGFEVFLPVKKVLRRKNRFGPDKVFVSQPLLADWLFVGWPAFESRWHVLMELDVVTGVMGTGGHPVRISSARMMRLMRQWGGGHLSPECHRMAKSAQAHVAGDVFRVPDGPFEDFKFTVVDATAKSVRGVIDIFGRETPLEIQADKLPDRDGDRVGDVAMPIDADGGGAFDPGLSACICGHRMATVVPDVDGFCITCGNCGRRAAVGSDTESAARSRWNQWLAVMS